MAKSFGTAVGVAQLATPTANPPAGVLWLYPKADGKWYSKNSSGVETAVDAGSSGEPVITPGTTAQYWRGDKTWQTLDKTAVGLGNVDNTSDASKPISTATQTALNGKAATSHTHTKSQITDLGTIGTAAAQNIPASGDAGPTEVVLGSDSRLSSAAKRFRRVRTVDMTGIVTGGGVYTRFPFNSSDENTDPSSFTYDGTTDFFNIQRAGVYAITVHIVWSSTETTGRRAVLVSKNDGGTLSSAAAATVVAGDNRSTAPAGATTNHIYTTLRLAAGDQLRTYVSHTQGANTSITVAGMGPTEFVITRLGD